MKKYPFKRGKPTKKNPVILDKGVVLMVKLGPITKSGVARGNN